MFQFFAVFGGILLLLGAIVSVPISTRFMNQSAEDLERAWRWRSLGIFVLLAGVSAAIFAFIILSRLLR